MWKTFYKAKLTNINYDTNIKFCFDGGISVINRNYNSLNNIRQECNHKVNIEFYWLIREKVSDIDIEYYKNKFNIKIIQEVESKIFFDLLPLEIKQIEEDMSQIVI